VTDDRLPPDLSSPNRDGQGPRRVLVVDDNLDSADTMAELMRIWGHEVRTAHDGPSALECAREFLPQVILLDVGLPGMDGYELARRLRADGLAGELLVSVTGYGQEEDRRLAQEAGFDHHLTKPVHPEALLRLVTRA
jgi:CheY-like chemotaxis protein